MPITVNDINEFIRIVEENPELKRALQERLVDAEAVQRALRDPSKRAEIRRAVLGDEWEDIPTILRQLAEGQQRHEAILQEHTRILQEHTQQLAMLIETQQRHEAILQEHTQQLAMLIETQQRHEAILQEHSRILQEHTTLLIRLDTDFQALRGEFQGLAGRFEGAVYEERTVRSGPAIFNGGGGGSPATPAVRRRLKRWFRAAFGEIPTIGDLENVYLADIIWWKDGTVILGEISIKVDRLDVLRAKQRAQQLRRAGVNATPVVIGTEWAMDETRELARSEEVEWIIGGQYSDKMMEFRKLPESEEDDGD